jgi:hypothetical protein
MTFHLFDSTEVGGIDFRAPVNDLPVITGKFVIFFFTVTGKRG